MFIRRSNNYDLYHNNCNVNYPTFYNRNLKKKKEEREREMEGARRPPPRIRKLSQRSVYLNPFLFLYRFILSSFVSVTIEYDRSICIHGAILLTSRFLIYLLFNKTAHSGARYISLFIVAPSLHPPLAISYVYHSPHRIEACPYNVTRNCQLISNAI